MIIWILVAVFGGVLSILGLVIFGRRCVRGEITLSYFLAILVGYVSFVAFVLFDSLHPQFASRPVSVAILLPAFVAIVLLIREHKKSKRAK